MGKSDRKYLVEPQSTQARHYKAASKSRRRQIALIGMSAVASAMLALPVAASSAQLVWNMSVSAPAGLYRIDRSDWTVGDRVVVAPSPDLAEDLMRRGILERGKLLIKRIAAAAGDTVCRHKDVVTVNGRGVARAKGERSDSVTLPSWQGCVTLSDQQVFLLGDGARSYDGRYFGFTSSGDILGRAVLLVTL